ncbi:MAG: hypothetical protein ACXAEX_13800 [Promethearchaeota archaeon]|jgi:N-formylglutamate amidohydrolase
MLNFTEYVEFQKGNIPLILSVPHGGTSNCENIPRRTHGILGIDGETIYIAKKLVELLKIKFNEYTSDIKIPSYIISKVPRSKIDLNRNQGEAYVQSSIIAKKIYTFYHGKIEEFVYDNIQLFGSSLLIDIHGFEKDNRPPGFRDVDLILGTNNLESLYSNIPPKSEWGENIRGKIIRKFIELDIPIAPGHPKRKEYVLTGGLITKHYGASLIPKSRTLQIEISDRIRIHDVELRTLVLNNLVEIFFKEFSHL